jgi:protein-export membrane protein SecD
MNKHIRWLIVIVLLAAFCLWVVIPAEEDLVLDFNDDDTPEFVFRAQQPLGLDLIGGLRVLLEAEIPTSEFSQEDLVETANNVSRRVNALGLSEATIQVQGNNRVLIELPGVTDREQAINTIQQTALLEFVDFGGLVAQAQGYTGQHILTDTQLDLQNLTEEQLTTRVRHPVTAEPFHTVITGAALAAASAQIDPQGTGGWFIQFEIDSEYQQTFADFTASRIGQPMAIVLDGEVLSAPTIQAQLSDGGVITGQFTQEEAQTLALQLRSGALPIPLSVESAVEVGATLGRESVELSIKAGIIGVIVVLTFMLVFYRVPGIAADLALGVFILLNMALFKLLPVTLTLPAITGFLISIGTAVDGNILIFERIKEELRAGKGLMEALDAGFDRAWTSIRDSNFSTIIICSILFLFGQTPGASVVSGFAVTLALGLILNLFTAIIVTRTFLYLIIGLLRNTLENRKWLLGV